MKLLMRLPDLQAPPPKPTVPPPDPALLAAIRAEGVAEGRAQGHAAGLAQGLAQGRAEQAAAQEAAVQRALEAIARALDGAAEVGRRTAEQSAEALAGVLFAVLDLALPGNAARLGAELVPAVLVPLLPALADRPEARLRVTPELAEAIAARLPARALEVVPDPTVPPGDARVEWRDGALAITLERRREAIRKVLRAADIVLPDNIVCTDKETAS